MGEEELQDVYRSKKKEGRLGHILGRTQDARGHGFQTSHEDESTNEYAVKLRQLSTACTSRHKKKWVGVESTA